MKRLGVFLCSLLVLYIIYYDINIGTLPIANGKELPTTEVSTSPNTISEIPYTTIQVSAGDTVLSIIEEINKDNQITSIENIIKDFEALNPETKAELLQIGKTYHFPIYPR